MAWSSKPLPVAPIGSPQTSCKYTCRGGKLRAQLSVRKRVVRKNQNTDLIKQRSKGVVHLLLGRKPCVLAGEKVLPSQRRKKGQAIWQCFCFSWLMASSVSLLSLHPQLLPEGLLLRPRLLCQHACGEHSGEGGQNEVGRDPLAFLHPALPVHELPGAPGQVRWLSLYNKQVCLCTWQELLLLTTDLECGHKLFSLHNITAQEA